MPFVIYSRPTYPAHVMISDGKVESHKTITFQKPVISAVITQDLRTQDQMGFVTIKQVATMAEAIALVEGKRDPAAKPTVVEKLTSSQPTTKAKVLVTKEQLSVMDKDEISEIAEKLKLDASQSKKALIKAILAAQSTK